MLSEAENLAAYFLQEDHYFITHQNMLARWSTLQDPRVARGNCYTATTFFSHWALQEQVPSLQEVGVLFKDGSCHFANLHQDVVIDFTARQFWRGIAFPLVTPLSVWREWVHERNVLNMCLPVVKTEVGAFIAQRPELLRGF